MKEFLFSICISLSSSLLTDSSEERDDDDDVILLDRFALVFETRGRARIAGDSSRVDKIVFSPCACVTFRISCTCA